MLAAFHDPDRLVKSFLFYALSKARFPWSHRDQDLAYLMQWCEPSQRMDQDGNTVDLGELLGWSRSRSAHASAQTCRGNDDHDFHKGEQYSSLGALLSGAKKALDVF